MPLDPTACRKAADLLPPCPLDECWRRDHGVAGCPLAAGEDDGEDGKNVDKVTAPGCGHRGP